MAKTYRNLALFIAFSFCFTPIFTSEIDDKTEQAAPEETQKHSDLADVHRDLQKVCIAAAFVGLAWALIYTYNNLNHVKADLVDAKTHIAELEGIQLARQLIDDQNKENALKNTGFMAFLKNKLYPLKDAIIKYLSTVETPNHLPVL